MPRHKRCRQRRAAAAVEAATPPSPPLRRTAAHAAADLAGQNTEPRLVEAFALSLRLLYSAQGFRLI